MRTNKLRAGLVFTLVLLATGMAVPSAWAQTFTVLYTFKGGNDGAAPQSSLVLNTDGNLYGTTQLGGGTSQCIFGHGCGTVFKIGKNGKETVLHSFTGAPDGGDPYAGLVRDKVGNLYGTTYAGGSSGNGTVFKMDRSGKETVIYSFGPYPDAAQPSSSLILDSAGNLYGASQEGGNATGCFGGCGTIFKVDATGQETVLYNLTQSTGNYPVASPFRDHSGNLYGTALEGGSGSSCSGGCGTIFKLSKNHKEKTLLNFAGGSTGGYPEAPLVRDAKGDFYGTTYIYGDPSCNMGYGCGVVFKLSPNGKETILHTFSGTPDGGRPFGSLLRTAKGTFYGITEAGGDATCLGNGVGCGTVFKMSKSGRVRVLHSFSGTDGAFPMAGLVTDSAGNLYGTTYAGGDLSCDAGNGAKGCGVVFKITP
jgi:uncharacterized repeat protein (TIGR03803 family)